MYNLCVFTIPKKTAQKKQLEITLTMINVSWLATQTHTSTALPNK